MQKNLRSFKLFLKLAIIILLTLTNTPVWAICTSNGNIFGINGPIVLGFFGCGDDAGNNQATVFSDASIFSPGDGLIVPLAIGHNPWNITNNGNIIAVGSGIDLQVGGDTITNQAGATIISFLGNAINATSIFAPVTLNNAGTIAGFTNGGFFLGGATVDNSGLIAGGNFGFTDGIILGTGGKVINRAGGLITGSGTGIATFFNPSEVDNAGTIIGGRVAAIEMFSGHSVVNNAGIIRGNVIFSGSNDRFSMTGGRMTGRLIMGSLGHETATFTDVSDANIGRIFLFDGGGGDQLIFNDSQHRGGRDLINWEIINLNNGSALTLSSDLTLGGITADRTARLNINDSTLYASNSVIKANHRPVFVNNAGDINLTSPNALNSLTIRGLYTGINGKLIINTVLKTDNSRSDKLIIDNRNGAGIANGNTSITVHNLRGTGALTTKNGILVVQAINHAVTTPTSFSLTHPIRAGAFDYRLFRGGINSNPNVSQDWFLRSTYKPNRPGSNPTSNPNLPGLVPGWAQLGGGLTLQIENNLGVYGYADDVTSLSGGHHEVKGVDGGVGLRMFW